MGIDRLGASFSSICAADTYDGIGTDADIRCGVSKDGIGNDIGPGFGGDGVVDFGVGMALSASSSSIGYRIIV
jgi:hypothetical protein